VLFGQLVDDPSAWPDRFPDQETQDRERRHLHKVIADMVEWPKSSAADQKRFEIAIEVARWEIARSVAWGLGEEPPAKGDSAAVLDYLHTKAPPVYDPFCGGGSIPLEAQRLGLRAYGSDLNPVAVLITKALIEFPPKFVGLSPVHPDAKDELRNWKGAQGLAEDVRRYGQWMRDEAEKRIGHLYPKAKLTDGSEATVIAWLWARTVASPDPAQKGAHVPLASSFVLSSKEGKEAIVVPVKDPTANSGWRFEVKTKGVTEADLTEAQKGTKGNGRGSTFVCLLSGTAINGAYIKAEGKAGRIAARLMAVVAEGERARLYLKPTTEHEEAAKLERPIVPELEQPTPERLTGGTCFAYGLEQYDKLFTARQLATLKAFSDLVGEARARVLADARAVPALTRRRDPDKPLAQGGIGPVAYADAIVTYLAFACDKTSEGANSLCTWSPLPTKLHVVSTFGRQALPMVWDYAESNPFASSSGNLKRMSGLVAKVLDTAVDRNGASAEVFQKDAVANHFESSQIFCTDPPYYDNIGYSDLSDFFYVWLRKTLGATFPDNFRRVLTPKNEELVATSYRHGGREAADAHFMDGMSTALRGMRYAANGQPLCIYYAFKQSEALGDGIMSPGWSAFLQAVVDSGLQVDGTWPVRTERSGGFRNKGANALAASVVLVCRKRGEEAPSIGRREFLRELKPAMAEAILAHQKAGIPLPDRRQAAIGPGIGVFSKYSMVREANDSAMRVATALALINKEIDALLSEGTEDLDPETRFALEWYQMQGYGTRKGGSGDAIAQLQAFNLSEARINASGIFRARGGDAKLLTRDEMHAAVLERYGKPWRPSLDDAFTVWELAQHMARSLRAQDGGMDAAGRLLAERRDCVSDVLLLAERLFELATTRGENDEALIWNELQTSWPEIENAADRATEAGVGPAPEQARMNI
jgi:putative DNA methylase